MSNELARKSCVPCRGDVPPLGSEELRRLRGMLGGGWTVVDGHHLEKRYEFDDFASALAYVNRLGAVAEEENHHPDVGLSWGEVTVTIYTHKIDGLTESDFVLAAKADLVRGG